MLKQTVTYSDLDGDKVTEDFYFNLSKAEIMEMELGKKGGFAAYIQKIVESNDGAELVENFKQILAKSVGRRSEDGKRFIKNDEVRDEFMQSDAYSELFMELMTDADKAAAFVRGIMPADMVEAADKGQVSDKPAPRKTTKK